MIDKWSLVVGIMLLSVVAESTASGDFPIPFSGHYQSLSSEAQELVSKQNNAWISIPQNVYLKLVKDSDILELQLDIEVLDNEGRKLYPIKNSMWLRHVGDNQLEVYKINKDAGIFERVGQGQCMPKSCSYEYVILAKNNGNPYQQKYRSTISWATEDPAVDFTQSGSLSAKIKDGKNSQDTWLVFKTWSNQFSKGTALKK